MMIENFNEGDLVLNLLSDEMVIILSKEREDTIPNIYLVMDNDGTTYQITEDDIELIS